MNPQAVTPMGVPRRTAKTPHGNAAQIQTMDPLNIRIMYKAEFEYFCCAQWCYGGGNFHNVPERKYLHVLENGYEFNIPNSCLGCCCSHDVVFKFFFDRGVYSQKGFAWKCGCLKGDPSLYANYSMYHLSVSARLRANFTFHTGRYVCFCMDCPDSINQCLSCYYPSMCGDRVMVLSSETVCCCCPTRACWWNNCCGLCGVKEGDPLPQYSYPFVFSLIPGTGMELAANMDNARNMWKQRLAGGGLPMQMGVSAIPVPVTHAEMVPNNYEVIGK